MKTRRIRLHSSRRCIRLAARAAIVAGLTLVVALAAPVNADILEATYEFSFEMPNPAWNSTTQVPFDLPRFDTEGGARTLAGYRVQIWGPFVDYSATYNGNPNDYFAVAQVEWESRLSMHGPDGVPLLPHQDPAYYSTTGGLIRLEPAFNPVEPPIQVIMPTQPGPYAPWMYEELNSDPALLAEVVGSGSLAMVAEMSLSDCNYSMPPEWIPDIPPDAVFDPGIVTITPELLHAYVAVTYLYTVPEPASLSLLAVGALAFARRR